MSSNAHGEDKGASGSGAGTAQAPKLRSAAHYPVWRADMEVFLERHNANRVHSRVMTATHWKELQATVAAWNDASVDKALEELLGADPSASSASSASSSNAAQVASSSKASGAVSEDNKKLLRELVANSTRVYGVLYAALPEELRKQADSIPRGFAYGLWHWLETKYQSTEQDSVAALIEAWVSLRQEDSESFDSYKARVDKLYSLLAAAKEPQSRSMYSVILLDRLQPHFRPVVLSLKTGDKLKTPSTVDWDAIAALINSFEREENRTSSDAVAAMSRSNAWANAAHGKTRFDKASSGQGERTHERAPVTDKTVCFRCGARGHISKDCSKPRVDDATYSKHVSFANGGGGGKQQAKSALKKPAAGAKDTKASNRYDSLSSSEETDEEESGQQRAHALMGTHAVYAMAASDTPRKRIHTMAELEKIAALKAKQEKEAADAAEESRRKREKRERQKDAKQPEAKPSALTAEQRATIEKARANKAKHDAEQTAAEAAKQEQKRRDDASKARKAALKKAVLPIKQPTTYSEMDKALATTAWGCDSMASISLSGNRDNFATLKRCPPVDVKTVDGNVLTAKQWGTVLIRVNTTAGKSLTLRIDDVYYSPGATSNLLSTETLTKRCKYSFHSTPEGSFLVTPKGSEMALSTKGRISVLLGAGPERVYSAPSAGDNGDGETSRLLLLHHRLGHMGFDSMVTLLRSGRVRELGKFSLKANVVAQAKKQVSECRACILGKQSRTRLGHDGLERGQRPAEVVHMDTYEVKFTDKEGGHHRHYGVSMIDAFTGAGWHSRVLSKDLVAQKVIATLREIEREGAGRIRIIFSDGGSEFVNHTVKAHLEREGITLRVSPPHTQQLNGVAERSIRTFKDTARTLLKHAGKGTDWLWNYAMSHAVWAANRTRVNIANGMTPYERASGRVPSFRERHVGVWGCDCFVHQRKEQRKGTMAAKSEPGIYLGHDREHNAPAVLILRTGKKVVSKDVRFVNDRFTHMRAFNGTQDEVDAVLDGEMEPPPLELRPDDAETESMQAQGENVQPSESEDDDDSADDDSADEATLAESEADEEPREYKIDKIVARKFSRAGIPTYRVRWEGYGPEDDTWEPEKTVADCAALDAFEVEHPSVPAPAAVRRSPRFVESDHQPDSTGSDLESDGGSGTEPASNRVEMAMCLRQLSVTGDWIEEGTLQRAFAATAKSSRSDPVSARTPKNLGEAMSSADSSKWQAARRKEYDSCVQLGVWEEVDRATLPKGTNILPLKEVFKIKVDEQGEIAQFKARFTPKGFRQKAGIDYNETFARTAMYKTERLALSLAARFDSELVQFDVPTAFLNADVEEEVFMEMPKGFGKDGQVCRLLKSLYGLKQAPRNWDKLCHSFITIDMGWTATVSDPSFYFKRSRTGRLMLIYRFVDDMQGQHHRDDAAEFEESSGMLRERFNIKQMETSTWMLGMRIQRDRAARTLTLDHELYIQTALQRFGLAQCKSVSTPEAVGMRNECGDPRMEQPADRQRFMEITGTLMYAAISSRPDIANAVHWLACNTVAPTSRHMQAAERVLRYLSGTKALGLVFGSRNGTEQADSRSATVECSAYADADWAGDRSDRRSISGWVAMINGDPISWSSKKQSIVALSTCEAELYAEAAAIQEVQWVRGMIAELGLESGAPSVIHGDNQSTLAVSKNGVKGERTKHVDVKYKFITECIDDGVVQVKWIPSRENIADIFTKPLDVQTFTGFRAQLMLH